MVGEILKIKGEWFVKAIDKNGTILLKVSQDDLIEVDIRSKNYLREKIVEFEIDGFYTKNLKVVCQN